MSVEQTIVPGELNSRTRYWIQSIFAKQIMDSKYIREIDSEWIVNSEKNNKFKVNSRTDNELKLYKRTEY